MNLGPRSGPGSPASGLAALAARSARRRDVDERRLGAAFTPDRVQDLSLDGADALLGATDDVFLRRFAATFDSTLPGAPPSTWGDGVEVSTITLDEHWRVADDGHLRYVHDALDRFVAAESEDGLELEVLYDGLGRRRVEKRRLGPGPEAPSTMETVVLHYEGPNVVGETLRQGATIVSETTHLPGVDTPILYARGATSKSSVNTFVIGTDVRGDAIGAVRITDGTLREEVRPSEHGDRVFAINGTTCIEGAELGGLSSPRSSCALSGTALRWFGIGGARAHPRTKLVDLRNRVYAPHLRGFLAQDPMGPVDSYGLWNYVAGDPVNFRDPWGLDGGTDKNGGVNPQEHAVGGASQSAALVFFAFRGYDVSLFAPGEGGCSQGGGCVLVHGAEGEELAELVREFASIVGLPSTAGQSGGGAEGPPPPTQPAPPPAEPAPTPAAQVQKVVDNGGGDDVEKVFRLYDALPKDSNGGLTPGARVVLSDYTSAAPARANATVASNTGRTAAETALFAAVGKVLGGIRRFLSPRGAGPVSSGGLHAEAEAARDRLAAEVRAGKHPPATVVGGYSPSSGRVAAGASRGAGRGCAEAVCAEALGNPADIKFTTAVRPRTGKPVPVCTNCETTYGRGAFPDPSTRFSGE